MDKVDPMELYRQSMEASKLTSDSFRQDRHRARQELYGLPPRRGDAELQEASNGTPTGEGGTDYYKNVQNAPEMASDRTQFNSSAYDEITSAEEVNAGVFAPVQFGLETVKGYGQALTGGGTQGVTDAANRYLLGNTLSLMDNPKEMEGALSKHFGDKAKFFDSKDGQRLVQLPSGTYVLNRPGLSKQDINSFASRAILDGASAGKGKLASQALRAGLMETAVQAGQETVGGEFDADMPVMAAGGTLVFGKAFEMAAPYVNKFGTMAKERLDDFDWFRDMADSLGDPTPDRTRQIAEAIQKRDSDTMLRLADGDPKTIDAFETLGWGRDIPPSMVVANDDMASILAGLEQYGKESANMDTKKFAQVYDDARQEIVKMTNSNGIAAYNDEYLEAVNGKIGNLNELENQAYNKIRAAIPDSLIMRSYHTEKLILEKMKAYGGDKTAKGYKELEGILKRVQTKPKVRTMSDGTQKITFPDNGKTAKSLKDVQDDINRELKSANFTGKGSDAGVKKLIAQSLKRDIDDAFTSLFAGGDSTLTNMKNHVEAGFPEMPQELKYTLKAARRIGSAKKMMEERRDALLGERLQDEIYTKLQSSLKKGTNYNVRNFRETLSNVEAGHRDRAVQTMMGGLFDKKPADFADTWSNIIKNPELYKEISQYVPKSQLKMYDSMATIIQRKQRLDKAGYKSHDLDKLLNNRGWLANKVYSSLYVPVSFLQSVFNTDKALLSASFRDVFNKNTNDVVKGNEFLADPGFRDYFYSMQKEFAGGMKKDLSPKFRLKEQAIMKSKAFIKWVDALPPQRKQQVMSMGLTRFLLHKEGLENDGE